MVYSCWIAHREMRMGWLLWIVHRTRRAARRPAIRLSPRLASSDPHGPAQLFLFNLLARKLCVVSYLYFSILEIFSMPFELYFILDLQNYRLYTNAFVKGFGSYCLGLQVHISTPPRFSFNIYVSKFFVFRIKFCLIDIYFSVLNLFF